ncbi:hypothetical protein BLNAU_19425 [Blattamonas nauphoetae]|uniref:Autophagy-related protein 2 n=1 Tax=Blattamonas nauphoetae TaxID=2049346 RepID=A0ABQ9X215_9EUKA|nr:hypothetical protein BLNAU_19425 [Blattamonas nauphoetae]
MSSLFQPNTNETFQLNAITINEKIQHLPVFLESGSICEPFIGVAPITLKAKSLFLILSPKKLPYEPPKPTTTNQTPDKNESLNSDDGKTSWTMWIIQLVVKVLIHFLDVKIERISVIIRSQRSNTPLGMTIRKEHELPRENDILVNIEQLSLQRPTDSLKADALNSGLLLPNGASLSTVWAKQGYSKNTSRSEISVSVEVKNIAFSILSSSSDIQPHRKMRSPLELMFSISSIRLLALSFYDKSLPVNSKLFFFSRDYLRFFLNFGHIKVFGTPTGMDALLRTLSQYSSSADQMPSEVSSPNDKSDSDREEAISQSILLMPDAFPKLPQTSSVSSTMQSHFSPRSTPESSPSSKSQAEKKGWFGGFFKRKKGQADDLVTTSVSETDTPFPQLRSLSEMDGEEGKESEMTTEDLEAVMEEVDELLFSHSDILQHDFAEIVRDLSHSQNLIEGSHNLSVDLTQDEQTNTPNILDTAVHDLGSPPPPSISALLAQEINQAQTSLTSPLLTAQSASPLTSFLSDAVFPVGTGDNSFFSLQSMDKEGVKSMYTTQFSEAGKENVQRMGNLVEQLAIFGRESIIYQQKMKEYKRKVNTTPVTNKPTTQSIFDAMNTSLGSQDFLRSPPSTATPPTKPILHPVSSHSSVTEKIRQVKALNELWEEKRGAILDLEDMKEKKNESEPLSETQQENEEETKQSAEFEGGMVIHIVFDSIDVELPLQSLSARHNQDHPSNYSPSLNDYLRLHLGTVDAIGVIPLLPPTFSASLTSPSLSVVSPHPTIAFSLDAASLSLISRTQSVFFTLDNTFFLPHVKLDEAAAYFSTTKKKKKKKESEWYKAENIHPSLVGILIHNEPSDSYIDEDSELLDAPDHSELTLLSFGDETLIQCRTDNRTKSKRLRQKLRKSAKSNKHQFIFDQIVVGSRINGCPISGSIDFFNPQWMKNEKERWTTGLGSGKKIQPLTQLSDTIKNADETINTVNFSLNTQPVHIMLPLDLVCFGLDFLGKDSEDKPQNTENGDTHPSQNDEGKDKDLHTVQLTEGPLSLQKNVFRFNITFDWLSLGVLLLPNSLFEHKLEGSSPLPSQPAEEPTGMVSLAPTSSIPLYARTITHALRQQTYRHALSLSLQDIHSRLMLSFTSPQSRSSVSVSFPSVISSPLSIVAQLPSAPTTLSSFLTSPPPLDTVVPSQENAHLLCPDLACTFSFHSLSLSLMSDLTSFNADHAPALLLFDPNCPSSHPLLLIDTLTSLFFVHKTVFTAPSPSLSISHPSLDIETRARNDLDCFRSKQKSDSSSKPAASTQLEIERIDRECQKADVMFGVDLGAVFVCVDVTDQHRPGRGKTPSFLKLVDEMAKELDPLRRVVSAMSSQVSSDLTPPAQQETPRQPTVWISVKSRRALSLLILPSFASLSLENYALSVLLDEQTSNNWQPTVEKTAPPPSFVSLLAALETDLDSPHISSQPEPTHIAKHSHLSGFTVVLTASSVRLSAGRGDLHVPIVAVDSKIQTSRTLSAEARLPFKKSTTTTSNFPFDIPFQHIPSYKSCVSLVYTSETPVNPTPDNETQSHGAILAACQFLQFSLAPVSLLTLDQVMDTLGVLRGKMDVLFPPQPTHDDATEEGSTKTPQLGSLSHYSITFDQSTVIIDPQNQYLRERTRKDFVNSELRRTSNVRLHQSPKKPFINKFIAEMSGESEKVVTEDQNDNEREESEDSMEEEEKSEIDETEIQNEQIQQQQFHLIQATRSNVAPPLLSAVQVDSSFSPNLDISLSANKLRSPSPAAPIPVFTDEKKEKTRHPTPIKLSLSNCPSPLFDAVSEADVSARAFISVAYSNLSERARTFEENAKRGNWPQTPQHKPQTWRNNDKLLFLPSTTHVAYPLKRANTHPHAIIASVSNACVVISDFYSDKPHSILIGESLPASWFISIPSLNLFLLPDVKNQKQAHTQISSSQTVTTLLEYEGFTQVVSFQQLLIKSEEARQLSTPLFPLDDQHPSLYAVSIASLQACLDSTQYNSVLRVLYDLSDLFSLGVRLFGMGWMEVYPPHLKLHPLTEQEDESINKGDITIDTIKAQKDEVRKKLALDVTAALSKQCEAPKTIFTRKTFTQISPGQILPTAEKHETPLLDSAATELFQHAKETNCSPSPKLEQVNTPPQASKNELSFRLSSIPPFLRAHPAFPPPGSLMPSGRTRPFLSLAFHLQVKHALISISIPSATQSHLPPTDFIELQLMHLGFQYESYKKETGPFWMPMTSSPLSTMDFVCGSVIVKDRVAVSPFDVILCPAHPEMMVNPVQSHPNVHVPSFVPRVFTDASGGQIVTGYGMPFYESNILQKQRYATIPHRDHQHRRHEERAHQIPKAAIFTQAEQSRLALPHSCPTPFCFHIESHQSIGEQDIPVSHSIAFWHLPTLFLNICDRTIDGLLLFWNDDAFGDSNYPKTGVIRRKRFKLDILQPELVSLTAEERKAIKNLALFIPPKKAVSLPDPLNSLLNTHRATNRDRIGTPQESVGLPGYTHSVTLGPVSLYVSYESVSVVSYMSQLGNSVFGDAQKKSPGMTSNPILSFHYVSITLNQVDEFQVAGGIASGLMACFSPAHLLRAVRDNTITDKGFLQIVSLMPGIVQTTLGMGVGKLIKAGSSLIFDTGHFITTKAKYLFNLLLAQVDDEDGDRQPQESFISGMFSTFKQKVTETTNLLFEGKQRNVMDMINLAKQDRNPVYVVPQSVVITRKSGTSYRSLREGEPDSCTGNLFLLNFDHSLLQCTSFDHLMRIPRQLIGLGFGDAKDITLEEEVFDETLDTDPTAIKVSDVTFFNTGSKGEITTFVGYRRGSLSTEYILNFMGHASGLFGISSHHYHVLTLSFLHKQFTWQKYLAFNFLTSVYPFDVLPRQLAPNDYQIVICDLDPIELEIFYVFAELAEEWIVGTYELRIYLFDRYAAHKNFFVLDKHDYQQHLFALRASTALPNPDSYSRPNSPESDEKEEDSEEANAMPLEND